MLKIKILSLIFFLTVQSFITFQTPSAKGPDDDNGPFIKGEERYTQLGVASWYGPGFQGRKTASGEVFDTYDFTAAHKYLPFGTLLKVTNLSNNLFTVVKVNDRGPYSKDRIIDLSKASKTAIGMDGVTRVRIDEITEEEAELLRNGIDPFENFVDKFDSTQIQASDLLGNQNSPNSEVINDLNDDIINNVNNYRSSGNLKVRIIIPKSGDLSFDKNLYKKIDNIDSLIRFYDLSKQLAVTKGFMIEVNSFDDKFQADRFISRLERDGFTKIYLEEVITKNDGDDNPNIELKVLIGLYESEKYAAKDMIKLKKLNYASKIVNIGLE